MSKLVCLSCDVAVIGGGPAGISACMELANRTKLNVHLFENESVVGGIPKSAHVFFGMRDLHRLYTGAAYARRLETLLGRTSSHIHTQSTVVRIDPGKDGQHHRLYVASPDGYGCYACPFIILATGCFESSRESRLIMGSRPAGIMTTGTLQKLVNLQGLKPGREAVILGSEHVALSAALTLKRAGMAIKGLVEAGDKLRTYSTVARALACGLGFPLLQKTAVQSVSGQNRVAGIETINRANGQVARIACDTVIVTGRFRPEAALIDQTGIEADPVSGAPLVDRHLQTSTPGIYAAGNLLGEANMHDLCALEGRQAAKSIKAALKKPEKSTRWVPAIKRQRETL